MSFFLLTSLALAATPADLVPAVQAVAAAETGARDERHESVREEQHEQARHTEAHHGHSAAVHQEARHRPYHRPPPPVYRRPPPPRARVVVRHPAPVPAPPPADLHDVSLTLSAVHAAIGMADASAEFRLGTNGGLDVTGGFGSRDGKGLYDLGLGIRGYAVGDFDRGLFLSVNGHATNTPFYAPTDGALTTAVTIGAKYTFDVPITIEGEIGPQLTASRDWRALGPMVKVNVGFSF